MFFINDIKQIFNNQILVLLLLISYILIFKVSKQLKRNNLHRDCKIVKITGILYGLLAIVIAVAINV